MPPASPPTPPGLRAVASPAAERVAHARHAAQRGVLYGIGAYGLWGLMPLYFKLVTEVPPPEVLAQRVLWVLVLLAGVATVLGKWREFWVAISQRRVLLTLCASTLLLSLNWFTYIYAVSTNQVVEASLGYFLNPLVNVVIGVTLLHERLRRWQLVSIVLAGLGVAIIGAPPIAISLALSFAFYGLLRKKVAVDGVVGLLIETLLLVPIALAYVGWLWFEGRSSFSLADPWTCLKLAASGPVTACPLLLFTAAVHRLRYSTLGFLQYLAPSIQFLLAVFLFHEELNTLKLVSLGCIWSAVIIYAVDSLRAFRGHQAQPIEPAPADV